MERYDKNVFVVIVDHLKADETEVIKYVYMDVWKAIFEDERRLGRPGL